jgi:hypothetical protein
MGGLVGRNEGTIRRSRSSAQVSGSGRLGGLVGSQFSGSIEQSFALGTVTGTTDFVGGLLGTLFAGQVSNCYARARVTASNPGGLIGNFALRSGSAGPAKIENSYAASTLSGTNAQGLIGNVAAADVDELTITSSYFLNTNTGTYGTALSSAAFAAESSFVGWDFSAVWRLSSGFPTLAFE